MSVEMKQTTRTRREFTLRVNGEELIEALNTELKAGGGRMRIPATATVIVGVPGGGDWSNTDLDIDDKTPICIFWTETEEG